MRWLSRFVFKAYHRVYRRLYTGLYRARRRNFSHRLRRLCSLFASIAKVLHRILHSI
jgi:hypothetical protein